MADEKLPSLTGLLSAGGVTMSPAQLDWMMLTWDVALVEGEANLYRRFFLTVDCLLITAGARAPEDFRDRNPVVGETLNVCLKDSSVLERAVGGTDTALFLGYRPVCTPLAIDMSSYAGQPDPYGARFDEAGDLLDFLNRESLSSRYVLADINRARAAAMTTHASPTWQSDHPDAIIEQLWEGR